LKQELINICGESNVSDEPEILKTFSKDLSFIPEKQPQVIVWPQNTDEVQRIIQHANKEKVSIITVSSETKDKFHGDTIPRTDNVILLNLSRMKSIIRVDKKNRNCMVEPGVTFKELIPEVEKHGMRLMKPLYPRGDKSALTAALERVPITIPRYQWDSSDPLLCTEVIFGTGDYFRTGAAAGPGTIEEQLETGQAQKNPLGPTQFSPYRLLQGAQGTMGVVTWATLKCEYKPTLQKVLYVNDDLNKLLDYEHKLIKYRLCDEVLILNNLNLATLLKKSSAEIKELASKIPKWTLIIVLSGRGNLDKDRVGYQEADIRDFASEMSIKLENENPNVSNEEILAILNGYSEDSWRLRLTGACQDIVFVSPIEKIEEFVKIVESKVSNDLGIYIQPIVQGTSHSCEFDIYYDAKDKNAVKENYLSTCKELIKKGAFFNRPYGIITKDVYDHHSPLTRKSLRKVKKIFDPNNVLNPGSLCFEEES
ncbi:MAG: FAD-binding oxidoreductase, partial [Candidatus Helarchaeota archaeon]